MTRSPFRIIISAVALAAPGVLFLSRGSGTASASASDVLVANRGSLAVGATATVTINVQATQAGVFTNTANVSGREGDEDTTDNTHRQQTTVVTLSKLTLSDSMVVGGASTRPESSS